MRFVDRAQFLAGRWRGQAGAIDVRGVADAAKAQTLETCADFLQAAIDKERAREVQVMQDLGAELHRMEQPEFTERLAARVHESWMAEKQRQGFADHAWFTKPGGFACCDYPREKHHSDMRPYDQLPDHIKEYDRATVRAVLDALAKEDAE